DPDTISRHGPLTLGHVARGVVAAPDLLPFQERLLVFAHVVVVDAAGRDQALVRKTELVRGELRCGRKRSSINALRERRLVPMAGAVVVDSEVLEGGGFL